jgi:hypothetical protein
VDVLISYSLVLSPENGNLSLKHGESMYMDDL